MTKAIEEGFKAIKQFCQLFYQWQIKYPHFKFIFTSSYRSMNPLALADRRRRRVCRRPFRRIHRHRRRFPRWGFGDQSVSSRSRGGSLSINLYLALV